MASNDDDLRARAQALAARREAANRSEAPESEAPERVVIRTKRNAGDLAKAAAPGAGLAALIAILQQLLTARVTPEQITGLRDRVDQLETDRTARRITEFERDKIENCRGRQADDYLRSLLPRRDQQVGPPPRAWFDQCPDLPEPTTGAKAAPKP